MTSSLLRPARWAATLLTALTLAAGIGAATPASAATPNPPVPASLPAGIEPLSGYVPATSCDPTAKPGAVALGTLLTTTYPGTRFGSARTCGADTSEHYDGRAVDWMNSVRVRKEAAQAKALISWLTATDADGNAHANARRLGVMYIIWNGKIWGAYSAERGWRAYSSCADHPEKGWDSTCHRDHVHLSLTWAGAMKRTSYWTGEVAATDYGPCRAKDLNWALPYAGPRPTPCPRHPRVTPPEGASATLRALTTYSGVRLRPGARGPAVTAVQKALGVSATGSYGTATRSAVKKFQTGQRLTSSGNVNTATWRALLRVNAPEVS
ncbi:Putative peptidoglycan binding domain-containing protein [Friedmanniella luteola]|uniref:Putative peptidoglycan binding domain-containing protein n=1 Tax=Friedmanniella luteola TaxID=546871 RepID=A0A1H1XFJ6_9ACTN|nr:peptidoglycan-binding domain-containing protein [Friedmanniella luteola]SDT07922.1 Putative peptidoglycan binding domain-containing protein [Friedmanniella luteola]